MKILAYADTFIPAEIMRKGLEPLANAGHDIEVRQWEHESVKAMQTDNLLVEQEGANALELPEALRAGLDAFEMIITQFAPIGKSIIEAASNLKYVGVLRGGIENVDLEAAEKAGVEVINTPGRNARAVAEFTMGMMLSEVRNIARSHAAMVNNNVFLKDFPNKDYIPELYRKTIGLVGFGNIARLVCGYLQAFGANVIAYEPYADELNYEGVEKVELDELLARADIVSLHMRMSDDTSRMIGKEQFAKMKDGAVFINSARSGLVDEDAMLEALTNGKLMGAALDVFDNEPLPDGHPFLSLPNVTLLPHLAGSTYDAFANSPLMFAERFLAR